MLLFGIWDDRSIWGIIGAAPPVLDCGTQAGHHKLAGSPNGPPTRGVPSLRSLVVAGTTHTAKATQRVWF